jgi:predicted DsbA family dithiol-disulfide isomerase
VTYLARKFGGTERAADVYARVERAGEAVGIPFAFDRIEIQPNTFDAHRLVAWAQQEGDVGDLVERLFSAFFVEGDRVGDRDTLARLAAECGLPEASARAMLASDALRDVVTAESREAVAAGIQGVPCFIFNGRIAVSGAQEPTMLLRAIATARGRE